MRKHFVKRITIIMMVVCIVFASSSSLINANTKTFFEEESVNITNIELQVVDSKQHQVDRYSKDSNLLITIDWSMKNSNSKVVDIDFKNNLKLNKVNSESSIYEIVQNKLRFKIDNIEGENGTVTILASLDESELQKEMVTINFKHLKSDINLFEVKNEPSKSAIESASNDNVFEDSETKIAVSRFDIYTSNNKYDFVSGEEVVLYTGISLTEGSGSLVDSILELSVPKENIKLGSFVASDISSQKSKEIFDDGDSYRVRYVLHPLASGTNLDIPLKFQSMNGETPNGFKIPVTAKLMSSSEANLTEPVKQFFTIETKRPVLSKSIYTSGYWTETENQKVNGGKESSTNPGYLSDNLSDLKSISFSFYLFQTSPNDYDYGQRDYESVMVEDTLPPNAVFIQEDNPGWKYDPLTHTARYEFVSKQGFRLKSKRFSNEVVLNLKFPNQKLDELITNSILVNMKPYSKPDYESSYVSSDTINFSIVPEKQSEAPKTFSFSKSINPWNLFDYPDDRETTKIWDIKVQNSAKPSEFPDLKLKDIVMKDFNLDPSLKYLGIEIGPNNLTAKGSLSITLTYVDDSTLVVRDRWNPRTEPQVIFPNQSEIKSVTLKFNEETYLLPGEEALFKVITELKDKTSNVLKESEENRLLYNSAEFKGTYSNGINYSGIKNDYIKFSKANAKISIHKRISDKKENYFLNDVVKYSLGVSVHNFIGEFHQAKTNMIVDILPDGLSYVPGSSYLNLSSRVVSDLVGNRNVEPEVVYNYKGTGQTALVWELKPFMYTKSNTIYSTDGAMSINYSTKITQLTKQGLNKNVAYLSWENNDVLKADSRETVDEFDLNGNGSTTDMITSDYDSFNYVPPRELLTRKEVKGSLNSNYVLTPNYGEGEISSDVMYRFTLFNNSIIDIKTLNFIDILPHENDLTVSDDISLEIPGRTPRMSNFSLILQGPINVPHGYKVMYTTDIPQSSLESKDFYSNSNWFETLEDYSKVTAFKIELIPGEVLRSGKEIQFEVNLKVPMDKTIVLEEMAVNSFGVATSSSLNFFESNLAKLKIYKYEVDGFAFKDENKNSLIDSSEAVFSNHPVYLEDLEGNPVLDLDGNVIQTVTDDNGYYHFDVYRQGKYRVKIMTPSYYENTRANISSELLGSHILDGENFTDTFTLNPQNVKERRNAGFYQISTNYKAIKNWEGGSAEHPDITIQLYQNGEKYGEEVIITANDREYTWLELPYRDSFGNIYEYSVDEINVPINYSKHVEGNIITNTYVSPVTTYTAYKKWVNGPELKPTISLQLYQNGNPLGDVVELKSGTTEHTWSDLQLTDDKGNIYQYTVDEIDTPNLYFKEVNDNTITNIFNPEKISVKGKKIWIGGADKKPEVRVQLYKNGEAFKESIVLKDGESSFSWENLDSKDINGVDNIYTIDEISKYHDYEKKVIGFTIYNTFIEVPVNPEEEKPEPSYPPKIEEPIVMGVAKDPVVVLPNTGFSNEVQYLALNLVLVGFVLLIMKRKK